MAINTQKIIGIVVVVAVLGSIFFLESRKTDRPGAFSGNTDITTANTMSAEEKAKLYEPAKEISSPDGFINVDDIKIADLVGKQVILVDFWTYSCINCQRTIPHLNDWHEKYGDKGLTIIGLHTPEFEFEKEYENVKRAVLKFGVKYPVVLDNDYSTWTSYKNRYWPRKYLIDIDGFIVYDHIGEGRYDETEKKIVELLNERNLRLGDSVVALDESTPADAELADFSKVKTPETYLGASRVQYLANIPQTGCSDGACNFVASGDPVLNTFELSGRWKLGEEEAVLEGDSGAILLHFSANKVNLVASGMKGDVQAEIYLDGKLIDANKAGADVKNGITTFSTSDLYNLIDLRGAYGDHILEIRFLKGGVSAFAFTFG